MASGTRARDLLAGAPAAIAGGTVCANDQLAFGVRAEVEAAGLRCPRDIAVTGFDPIHRPVQHRASNAG